MACPRFDDNGNEIFAGKIGVFPSSSVVPAQCRSRNRDVGMIEMKSITLVTREVVRAYLVDDVIPAIRNVWPRKNHHEVIYIQQDIGFHSAIQ
ncbi:hypothetical protein LIER_34878 [Lithospermum erythrorhizon]|uniref:Transposase n=1 Tax=Lithospermum erythrorhizon TaxID=34254 RepID=A0AAV3S3C9_LITER